VLNCVKAQKHNTRTLVLPYCSFNTDFSSSFLMCLVRDVEPQSCSPIQRYNEYQHSMFWCYWLANRKGIWPV